MKKKMKTGKDFKILRLFFVFLTVFCVVGLIVFILKKTDVWNKINSVDKIRKIVESGGFFSSLIFMLLQLLQTTILQIPSFIITISGAIIFGRWKAFLLSYIAVMIGSIIMFFIGRKAGRKFLNWIIGKDNTEKWLEKMTNGKYLYFLMMLFPLFPDDILCVVAGLTKMSFKFFLITNFIARGLGIGCTVFFGSGAVIPFYGWGLIVWVIIAILIGILFYLSVKFKDKIDFIVMQFSKQKNKKDKNIYLLNKKS